MPIQSHTTRKSKLEHIANSTKYIISVDGSSQEVEVTEEYPTDKVCYIQISGVMTYLSRIKEEKEKKFVDPADVEKIAQDTLQNFVLPGSNVPRKDCETVQESWRKEIYEYFKESQVEGTNLYDFFLLLLEQHSQDKKEGKEISIPNCPKCGKKTKIIEGQNQCLNDKCKGEVYATDRLRIFEEVNEVGSNTRAMNQLMGVVEQLELHAFMRQFLENAPEKLAKTAFIKDGPLAVQHVSARLHESLQNHIEFIYDKMEQKGLEKPIILGLEKSGEFRDHANKIEGQMSNEEVLKLPDEYIYDYIRTFKSESDYGSKTYYGQKFIYKSKSGGMHIITVPKYQDSGHQPEDYPELRPTLDLLDEIETALYDDAIVPVALAHKYASIPLKTGSRVLELMSRDALNIS